MLLQEHGDGCLEALVLGPEDALELHTILLRQINSTGVLPVAAWSLHLLAQLASLPVAKMLVSTCTLPGCSSLCFFFCFCLL